MDLKSWVCTLRQAYRRLGVTLVIVLSIALGVSANAVVFGWIEALVINPLPAVRDTNRLFSVTSRAGQSDFIDSSWADFADYREQLQPLGDLFLHRAWPVSLDNNGQPKAASGSLVSANYFSGLDLTPALGRFFDADDLVEAPGGKRVAVISYSLWQSRFAGDDQIVGQSLRLNNVPFSIIGVAPERFTGVAVGGDTNIWLPLMQRDTLTGGDGYWIQDRKTRPYAMMMRLRDGVDASQVQAQLDVTAARLEQTYARTNTGIGATVFPFYTRPDGDPSSLTLLLMILFMASAVVLAIIAVNLVNLMLARAGEREKEVAIRKAVGAKPREIFTLFVQDGLLYGALAALLCLIMVPALGGSLAVFAPDIRLPSVNGPALTGGLTGYTVGLALIVGLLVSLIPAWRASRVKGSAALNDSSRGGSMGRRRKFLSSVLIVCQAALAFVALASAFSFVDSFRRVAAIDPGFAKDGIYLSALTPSAPIADREQLVRFTDAVAASMEQLPEVDAVAFGEFVPLGFGGGSWEDIAVRGYTPRQDEDMKILRNFVSEGYFDVLQIPLIAGRGFRSQDDSTEALVGVINETFANRYFEGRDPIGRTIVGWGQEIRIVGVAADSKYLQPTEAGRPYLYMAFRQFADPGANAVMHVASSAKNVDWPKLVADQVSDVGSLMYSSWHSPMTVYTQASVFTQRVLAVLLGLMAVAAIILSGLGIYGVVSYSVAQRSQEVGIRLALGASAGGIFRMVLLQSLRVVAIGLFVGALLYLFMWEGIRELLYGVDSVELLQLILVVLVLATVATVASLAPTLRLSRLDPASILRTI